MELPCVQLTDLFWPLLLKTMCRAAEPAGLKGGILFHISKGKPGLQNTCDALSKVFHRSLPGLAVRRWSRDALPLQLGGRAGCSAVFGHLCSRSLLSFARQRGLWAGLLFVDLASIRILCRHKGDHCGGATLKCHCWGLQA